MSVTVHETPSQALMAKALEEIEIKDSVGRKFKLRKPGLLHQFKLVECLGPELSANNVYMGMCTPLIYIMSIDGELIPQPVNKIQMDGLIARVEVHGIEAIVEGLTKHFGRPDPAADQAAIKK